MEVPFVIPHPSQLQSSAEQIDAHQSPWQQPRSPTRPTLTAQLQEAGDGGGDRGTTVGGESKYPFSLAPLSPSSLTPSLLREGALGHQLHLNTREHLPRAWASEVLSLRAIPQCPAHGY